MMRRSAAIIAGMVFAVLMISVGIGLTTPDGSIADDDSTPIAATVNIPSATPSSAAVATPTPTTTPSAARSSADRAPAEVAGIWPGRPDATTVTDDVVDWCPAVKTDASADARQTYGNKQVARAACAAVSFVFDHRYSRLALPRATYRKADFKPVLADLTHATAASFYQPRIDEFVNQPDATSGSARLGLVLLDSPGTGYTFYGPRDSTRGYQNRAVWINPTWSTVSIAIDRAKSVPRAIATFTASAAIPVFNVDASRDDMVTVTTKAHYVLRHEGGVWRIAGWTITDQKATAAPLTVR